MSSAEPGDRPPILQRARSRFVMYGCRISRTDLDRVLALARQNFSSPVKVSMASIREYGGISSYIYGRSIEELLDSVRHSTFPGDPGNVDNVNLNLTEDPQARSTIIFIRPENVQVIVEGSEPGWVRGQIAGLKDFFSYTRAKCVVA